MSDIRRRAADGVPFPPARVPEFRITRADVPGVWENYVSNDEYCVIITPGGRGVGFHRHLAFFQVTAGGRAVYLRDLESGRVWSLANEPPHPAARATHEELAPVVLSQDYQRAGGDPHVPLPAAPTGFERFGCVHRAGSTRITSLFDGIEASFEVVVPVSGSGELWRVELVNRSGRERVIAVMPTVGLVLGGGTAMLGNYPTFNVVAWDASRAALSASNLGIRYWGLPNLHATLAAATPPEGMTATRGGAYRAITEGTCDHAPGAGEPIQALFMHRARLADGEEARFDTSLAAGFDPAETRERALRSARPGAFDLARREVDDWWESLLDRVRFDLPDPALSAFANGWLQAEVVQCARWTRGGGERGYRDVLQDAWALAPLRPEVSRDLLVDAVAHQYVSGFAPRSYAPIDGPPPGTRHASDSALWIPLALGGYVRETGDTAILDEALPFIDSEERVPALEHAARAVRRSFEDRGEHGIPRFRAGDWNDGLDGAGVAGRGESVWLGMCLVMAAEQLAELAAPGGAGSEGSGGGGGSGARAALAADSRRIAREVRDAIEHHGWDGGWYLQGWNDRGEPLGSRASREGRIFLMPQAWALLGGFGDDARRAALIAAVERELGTAIGPRLLAPPYTRRDPGIGRATARVPGTSDNAGVQTHAAVMMGAGYLAAGRAEEGVRTLFAVTPMNPARERPIRGTPPFVLNSQTIGPDNPRFGHTEIGWLTGAAGWLFRTLAERVAGVRPEVTGLRIAPCVPDIWDRWGLSRIFRGSRFEVRFERGGASGILVDGRPLAGDLVPLPARAGGTVRVTVRV